MPMTRERYPDNWEAISLAIRRRSGGRRECTGECGAHTRRCEAVHSQPHPETGAKVILTVAHLGIGGDKRDKSDCRPENLKAMCQACHLRFDIDEHLATRRRRARQKIIDAGQLEMPL